MKRGGRDEDGRSGTILLVEDSDVVREVIARMLEDVGFTVLPASGGEDALSISRREDVSFDLLLTDVVMPEMKGTELRRRLEVVRPGIPTVFMSGYASGATGGLDGAAVLQKPFTAPELALELLRALRWPSPPAAARPRSPDRDVPPG